MKGTASHLLEFLEGARKRFIIPVYQRNYDWKRENCKQLFDDLVSVIKEQGDGTCPGVSQKKNFFFWYSARLFVL